MKLPATFTVSFSLTIICSNPTAIIESSHDGDEGEQPKQSQKCPKVKIHLEQVRCISFKLKYLHSDVYESEVKVYVHVHSQDSETRKGGGVGKEEGGGGGGGGGGGPGDEASASHFTQ